MAIAASNANWVPGLVIMRSEVLHKGETNVVHEMWTQSTLATNGEVVKRTVKVLEDGKDVTEEEKRKAKSEKKKPGEQPTGNPFDASAQERLSLKVMTVSRLIAGLECVGYGFELRNKNGPTARGVAWLDKATGVPTKLENITLDPLPDKHLKKLAITTLYEMTAEGAWRPKELLTTGKASILFINVEIQSTTTFTNYWKKP